jgi:cellobiose dehydrogenase (acceptor)
LTPISQSVNSTHFELIYRCQWCWVWSQDDTPGSQIPATTTRAAQIIGWVQATTAPTTPDDPDSAIVQHDDDGIFGAVVASARNTAYESSWISLATATATTPTATGNSTSTSNSTAVTTSATLPTAPCAVNDSIPATSYDYIVVGAGAGGNVTHALLTHETSHSLCIQVSPLQTSSQKLAIVFS